MTILRCRNRRFVWFLVQWLRIALSAVNIKLYIASGIVSFFNLVHFLHNFEEVISFSHPFSTHPLPELSYPCFIICREDIAENVSLVNAANFLYLRNSFILSKDLYLLSATKDNECCSDGILKKMTADYNISNLVFLQKWTTRWKILKWWLITYLHKLFFSVWDSSLI